MLLRTKQGAIDYSVYHGRVIEILPNKFQGVVGEHEDFPIECIKLSHDKTYLASSSHDETVRFWDVRYLTSGTDDEEDEETQDTAEDDQGDDDNNGSGPSGGMDVDSDDSDAPKKKSSRRPKRQAPAPSNPGFFDDL